MDSEMIFSENKYFRWYVDITTRGQSRNRGEGMERHHILPKCLGGSNAKKNLVFLTYREHFIAHWLLTKCTTGENRRLMCCALACMNCSRNGRALTSVQFALTRRARSEASRGKQFALGAVRSAETRAKMSAAWKDRSPEYFAKLKHQAQNRSPETREKLRLSATNISDETRARRSASASKRRHTDATKEKLRLATTGNTRCQGRVLTDETKAKIGAASKLVQARLKAERQARNAV